MQAFTPSEKQTSRGCVELALSESGAAKRLVHDLIGPRRIDVAAKHRLILVRHGKHRHQIDLVLSDSARQFNTLDRYQRRALGRLKRAIEDFDTVRILESINAQQTAA